MFCFWRKVSFSCRIVKKDARILVEDWGRTRIYVVMGDAELVMTNRRILLEDFWHIFERFYQGSDVRATGSGLGLAIVQSIAQAHGGQVFVESEQGVGSLFVIELADHELDNE